MGEWMEGQTDGGTDRWMDGWVDGWIDREIDGWKNKMIALVIIIRETY